MSAFLPASVRGRILVLAIVPALTIGAFGAAAYVVNQQFKANLATIERYRQSESGASRLERAVTEMARIAFAYHHKPSPSEAEALRKTLENAGYDLADLRKVVVEDNSLKEIGELEAEITKIKAGFDALVASIGVAGTDLKTGASGEMAKSIEELEKRLDAPEFATLRSSSHEILDTYIQATDGYRAMPSKEALASADAALAAFRTEIGKMIFAPDQLTTITASVDALDKAFKSYVEAAGMVRSNLAKLDITYSNAVDRAESLATAARATADIHAIRYAQQETLTSRILYGSMAGLILLLLGLSFIVSRSITRPLSVLSKAMLQLGKGDTSVIVSGTESRNEIGAMAKSVQFFKDAMIERERLSALEGSNLEASESRRIVIESMIDAFRNETAADLVDVATINDQLGGTANSLGNIAQESSAKASLAAQAAERAASNVNMVSEAATELSRSIEEISQQVGRTNDIVNRAASVADDASLKISTLAKSAEEIGNVVSLIQQIAEQTNLLALNATIEAARAGDAGRGFAVVAQEVKGLSGQTSQATAEIGSRIAAVQESTKLAVGSIAEITSIMRDVSTFASSIAAAVVEQEAATNEISRSVAEAADGASNVLKNVRAVDRASSETNQAASEVAQASSAVGDKGSALKSRIEHFLQQVAAA